MRISAADLVTTGSVLCTGGSGCLHRIDPLRTSLAGCRRNRCPLAEATAHNRRLPSIGIPTAGPMVVRHIAACTSLCRQMLPNSSLADPTFRASRQGGWIDRTTKWKGPITTGP